MDLSGLFAEETSFSQRPWFTSQNSFPRLNKLHGPPEFCTVVSVCSVLKTPLVTNLHFLSQGGWKPDVLANV